MPFIRVGPGKIKYLGVDYNEIECGGGGDCLFYSLRWLLHRSAIDGGCTYNGLRTSASVTLISWAIAPPNAFPVEIPLPDGPTAASLGNPGVYGELACIAALVEQYAIQVVNPQAFRVHILGPNADNVIVYQPLGVNAVPTTEIHLLHIGYYHYRALWPTATSDDIPAIMQVTKTFEGAKTTVSSKSIFASLNNTNGASHLSGKSSSTFDASTGASLEIHHINVGQGDSALVFIKNKVGSIERTILIDTGDKTGDVNKELDFANHPVKLYMEALASKGNFRPVDILMLSHWDFDHMGAAAQFLNHGGKFFNRPLEIYDVGDFGGRDTDYDNYMAALKKWPTTDYHRFRPKPSDLVLNYLGIQITCIACSEIGVSSLYDPTEIDSDLLDDNEPEDFLLTNINTSAIPMNKLAAEDIVDFSSELPGRKNNASIGWIITFGEFTYFTAGDLENEAEIEVVLSFATHSGRHICAWKLSHHGSHMSTRARFLTSALPRFGVASCGFGNMHGHPGRAVIPRIVEINAIAPCKVFTTGDVRNDPMNFGVPDGVCTFANQGNILISVSSDQAADKLHRFTVISSGGTNEELTCGDRTNVDWSKVVFPDDHKELMKELSDVKKRKRQMSQGRKTKRQTLIGDTARDWLLKQMSTLNGTLPAESHAIQDWLIKNGLKKAYDETLRQMQAYVKQQGLVSGDTDAMETSDREALRREIQDVFPKLLLVQIFLSSVAACTS